MRFRSTIVLFFMVLILGVAILWVEKRMPSTRKRAQLSQQAMAVDFDTVTDLRIEKGDFVLECVLGSRGWRIRTPVDVRADSGELDRLLASFAALPRQETITEEDIRSKPLNLDAYGLDRPRARITLGDANARRVFAVGQDAPLGGSLYLLDVTTGDIVVTETNAWSLLPRSADDLRDRTLFPGTIDQVQRLEIRNMGGLIQAVRAADGNWLLQQPVSGRADRARIAALLEPLINARVLDFVAEQPVNPDDYGLGDGAVMALLTFDNQTGPHVLCVGDRVAADRDRVYAKLQAEKPVLTISRSLAGILQITADELRDRRLLNLPGREVNGLALSSGDSTLLFARKPDEDWEMLEPRAWKADLSQVSLLISRLAGLRIESFADAVEEKRLQEAFRQPALQIHLSRLPMTNRVWEGGTAEAVSLLLVPATGQADRVWIRIAPENMICSVSNFVLNAVRLDPLFYRAREVLHLGTANVARLSVKAGDFEQAVVAEGGGPFRMDPPAAGTIDRSAIERLLLSLRQLTTPAFVEADPKDLHPYGLATPRAEVTVQLEGQPATSKTLLLGEDWGKEGVYAMLRGEDVVFVLPAELRDRALAPWSVAPGKQ